MKRLRFYENDLFYQISTGCFKSFEELRTNEFSLKLKLSKIFKLGNMYVPCFLSLRFVSLWFSFPREILPIE